MQVLYIYLFIYLEFIVPLENFSLIWRRHHCRWRAAHFDLSSALMAIEQWGFFNVPHPLRHQSTVYDGHLRGPVTLTPLMPSVWQWSCHYLFSRLRSVATGDRTPISRMRRERSTSTPPRRGTLHRIIHIWRKKNNACIIFKEPIKCNIADLCFFVIYF